MYFAKYLTWEVFRKIQKTTKRTMEASTMLKEFGWLFGAIYFETKVFQNIFRGLWLRTWRKLLLKIKYALQSSLTLVECFIVLNTISLLLHTFDFDFVPFLIEHCRSDFSNYPDDTASYSYEGTIFEGHMRPWNNNRKPPGLVLL